MSGARVPAFPDWLDREDADSRKWSVSPGHAGPGGARTDVANKRMSVPLDESPLGRSVRIREMVRAKLSPAHLASAPEDWEEVPGNYRDMAEALRANVVAKTVYPDYTAKCGHEKFLAEQAVKSLDANSITDLIVRTAHTDAARSVLTNLRKAAKGEPKVLKFINMVNDTCKYYKYADRFTDSEYWTHNTEGDSLTNGDYQSYTLAHSLAEMGGTQLVPSRPGDLKTDEDTERTLSDAGFAKLILDKVPLTERVAGRLGRKRIATNIGVNPRRINRMLTDPDMRIFDRRARNIGGVILIDQSGSMRLSTDDIWELIKASPGCTIIGYSHSPGSDDVPNVWVLAERGHVCATVREGNGGNGVDGPALVYALSKHKKGEPFIWVCDGFVTNQYDDYTTMGATFCRAFVRKHRIHMAHNVKEGIEALKQVRDGKKLPTRLTGNLNDGR